jgi:RNA polymerase sigma-70 factor (ECF subfamily)
MQEAFVKLWENCSNVNIEKVKSYLFSTANNMFLNEIKHQKVVRKYEKHNPTKDVVETPEFIAIEKEFLEKINKVIASLPKKQKEVFVMSRIEKKKYKDIADVLDISVKSVEKRMQRALITVREEIGNI